MSKVKTVYRCEQCGTDHPKWAGQCTDCGECVYTCPFGAVVDKSYIVDAINLIKESRKEPYYEVSSGPC